MLVSDPHRKKLDEADDTKKSAISTITTTTFQDINDWRNGYVKAKIEGINFYSCY